MMMETLTSTQRASLALIPKITSLLSILSAVWLLVEILTQSAKRQQTYHRLVAAWSLYQLLTSGFLFLSTWPIPNDHGDIYHGALGNETTCRIQGFFWQLELDEYPVYSLVAVGTLAFYFSTSAYTIHFFVTFVLLRHTASSM